VLVDGTFCQAALKNKINLNEQIPKYLCDTVKLLTTVCVVTETEKLGPVLYGASLIVKQFPVRKCGHEKKPISASQCLHSLMNEKANADHYILATQDAALSEQVRQLPGCPLLYIKLNAINFEKPSNVSQSIATADISAASGPLSHDLEVLNKLKETELGASELAPKKKRKGPKGPNPLAMKKKKKKVGVDIVPKQSTESDIKKTRKRKKLKIPNKMAKLLDSVN
jgi:U3 small nucleolar RNA-associated protein 23